MTIEGCSRADENSWRLPDDLIGHRSGAPKGATGRVEPEPDPDAVGGVSTQRTDGQFAMLWTILIILAIVALVLFILSRVRGGRGA